MRRRDANIELLRIVLLLMVICLHVISPYRQTRFDKFTFSWQFTGALASVSRLCTNVFVLISGYFYTSALKKNPLGTALKLLLPVAAYIPLYFILDLGQGFNEALGRVVQGLLQNENNFYHLWYLQTFFVLTLMAPLLAAGIENSSRRVHKTAMGGLLVSSAAIPTFTYLTGLNWFDLRLFDGNLLLFIGLFVTGAYIRRYPSRVSVLKAWILFGFSEVFIALGNVLYNSRYSPTYIIQLINGQIQSLEEVAWIETQSLSGAFGDPRNIFVVGASVAMLTFFYKLRLKKSFFSYAVTNISGHVYGAYIIHVFWIQVFSRLNNGYFDLYSYTWPDGGVYPVYIFGFIIAVAVCSLLTDWVVTIVKKKFIRLALRLLLGSEASPGKTRS